MISVVLKYWLLSSATPIRESINWCDPIDSSKSSQKSYIWPYLSLKWRKYDYRTCREGSVIPSLLSHPVVLLVSQTINKTPAQVLLRYFVQQGIVVIPKSVTPSRIQENFQVSVKPHPLKLNETSPENIL